MPDADDTDDRAPETDVRSQLLAFLEHTSDLVGVVDEHSRVRYLNEAARKRLGVGDSTELTTVDLFPPAAFTRYYDEIRPTLLRGHAWQGELPLITGTGEAVPMAMTVVGRVGPGGEVNGLVTYGREIEEPAAARGTPPPVYDELTGLPGRTMLEDRLRVALAAAARDARRVVVIFADVDDMKDVNDSFGHAIGDDALREIARALSHSVRSGDTVARFGSDEFVVLLDGLDEPETAPQFAERLRDLVCRIPVDTGSGSLAVTASFGLAVGTPGDEPSELLRRADAAMYRAKARGRNEIVAFDDGELDVTTLAGELAVAVSHGLIRPHVQPVIDLHRGVLVGYQGLARWEHPVRGLLAAEQFVDLAAGTPILPVVDLAVLRRTVAAAARTARGGAQVRPYGHLSRRLLGAVDLTRYLNEIIDDFGIAPSDLCVEIAHGLVARPSRAVERALRDLRASGVRTVLSAVDGECEVNQIIEHGFEEIRLAMRLVRDASRDETRRRVAHGTVALARALGLKVTAVGIETEAERVDMRDAGCDFGVGHLFGAPQPAGSID